MDLVIQDYIIPQEPKIATRIHIQVLELKFGNYVKFRVDFYLNDDIYDMLCPKSEVIIIEGDEYKAWKDDDSYITDLIFLKLGLRKKIVE